MAWAPPKVGQRKNSIITSIITEGAERGWSDKYLQRQLKAVLPLTARQRTAVTVYRRSLREQGVPPARVTMLVERYMDKLKNQRAAAVARTERKKLETELLHRTIGELPLEREWTSQSGCCVVCKALTGMRTTTVYGPGLPGPPAHPNCRCSEKIHKLTSRVTSGVYKAHDGDGDKWVLEGTPYERPWKPGDTPSYHLADKSIEAKKFDDLPDDTPVVLFHGTSGDGVKRLQAGARGRTSLGDDISANTQGDGLYVAPTREDADFYVPKGDGEVIEVMTLKKHVVASPEAASRGKTPGQALYDSFEGAMIDPDAPFVVKGAATKSLAGLIPEDAVVKFEAGISGRNHRLMVTVPSKIGPLGLPIGGTGEDIGRISWSSETGVIEAIQVESKWQRRGIATAIFDEAMRIAEEQGLALPAHGDRQTSDGEAWSNAERNRAITKAHDGDGDQWVYDSTEAMRPKGPGDTPKTAGRVTRQQRTREAIRSIRTVTGSGGFKPATEEDRKRLAIPPAWTDVEVSEDPEGVNGLLARGRDAKGRRQGRYSAAHTEQQAAVKFNRVKRISPALPRFDRQLKKDALTDDSAGALTIIRRLGMRLGGEGETGAEVQAYGANTLERRHVKIEGRKVTFDFIGKKGVHITIVTSDPEVRRVVQSRLDRDGDDTDQLFPETSENKIRAYLRTHMPEDTLVKDLRTIRANELALDAISKRGRAATMAEYKKARLEVGEVVSSQLGNNRSEALKSYINPTVFLMLLPEGADPQL